MAILISLAGLLVVSFVVFAIVSDPGTAAMAKKNRAVSSHSTAVGARNMLEEKEALLDDPVGGESSSNAELPQQYRQEEEKEEKWDDQDLETPLLGRAGERGSIPSASRGSNSGGGGGGDGNSSVGRDLPAEKGSGIIDGRGSSSSEQPSSLGERERSRQLSIGAASVHTISLDNEEWHGGGWDEGGTGQTHQQEGRQRPVVLRWSKLGYYVPGQGKGRGLEMAVLRGVSGFAGPELRLQDGAFTAQRSAEQQPPRGNAISKSNSGGNVAGAATAATSSASSGDGGNSSCGSAKGPTASSTCLPSTMTGILGPSGAGKSSLLDLLAGRKRLGEGRATGSVSLAFFGDTVGDGELRGGAEAVRRIGGYVSQEDVLPGTLTCYEHLMFHARLRMPPGTSLADRTERVLWVVEELGLSRVADSRIGDDQQRGLSGGERRRLSIATALVARPALLFADEPTTGLGERRGRVMAGRLLVVDRFDANSMLLKDRSLYRGFRPPYERLSVCACVSQAHVFFWEVPGSGRELCCIRPAERGLSTEPTGFFLCCFMGARKYEYTPLRCCRRKPTIVVSVGGGHGVFSQAGLSVWLGLGKSLKQKRAWMRPKRREVTDIIRFCWPKVFVPYHRRTLSLITVPRPPQMRPQPYA